MKILYNGLCINGKLSGVQYYSQQLMRQAQCNDADGLIFRPVLSEAIVSAEYYHPHPENIMVSADSSNRIRRIICENTTLPALFRTTKSDLLHCPAYILPPFFAGRSVLTVHDTIALDYPAYCKPASIVYFGLLLGRSIRNASHIIAVSEKVKMDIQRLFPRLKPPVTVIYPGVDPIFKSIDTVDVRSLLREKYSLPEHYMLFVGTIEPKKNLINLLYGFKLYRLAGGKVKLVLVGQWGWRYKSIKQFLSDDETAQYVILLDYVPRSDLPALYSMAELFVFPSLTEGFGFPPLEAMACGTPVLMSERGSLTEIASADCRFLDPENPGQIADRLKLSLEDKAWRQRCRISGPQHAAAYTWKRAWADTCQVYKSLA